MDMEASNAAMNTRLEEVLEQTADVRQTITDLESNLATARQGETAAKARAAELEAENNRISGRIGDYRDSVPVRWAFLAVGLMVLVGFFAGFLWFDHRSRKRYGGFRVY